MFSSPKFSCQPRGTLASAGLAGEAQPRVNDAIRKVMAQMQQAVQRKDAGRRG